MDNIITGWWTIQDDELIIRLKTTDGWSTVRPSIRPYFFIREKDFDRARKYLTDILDVESGDYITIENEPVLKIETFSPSDVKKYREILYSERIPTYEADIPFIRRWMIDKKHRVAKNPKVLFFDVEVDAREGFARPENPSQRILSIAAVDENEKEYFICEDDEEEIFNKFNKLLDKYDIAVGWNNLRWDNPYLEARAKTLGINFFTRSVEWIDGMQWYAKLWGQTGTSLRLDDVSEKELGEHKTFNIYQIGGAEALWRMFKEQRDVLREYNVTDCLLVKRLNDKYGIINLITELARLTHVKYSDCYYYSRLVDSLLLKFSLKKTPRIVHPTKNVSTDNYSPYAGGYVMDPISGLYENVIVFDYQSMYPRIIRSFNIGIDTLSDDGEILTGSGARFLKKPRSMIAEFIELLDNRRTKYKKLMSKTPKTDLNWKIYQVKQLVYKILLNSCYGVFGSPHYRLYNKIIAEAVTLTGQKMIQIAISVLEDMGFKVLYADTDSAFALIKGNAKRILKEKDFIVELVNDGIREIAIKKFNIPREYYCMNFKIDYIFRKLYLPKEKKRYIGVTYESLEEDVLDDYIDVSRMLSRGKLNEKIVGFEIKRKDVPEIVRTIQSKIFDILFESRSLEEAERKVIQFLNEVKKNLYEGFLDTELIISKTVTKDIEKYGLEDVHVKVAKILKNHGLFRPGDDVQFVITDVKDGDLIGYPIIPGVELPKITHRGYDYYWKRRILPVVEKIFSVNFVKHIENMTLYDYV